MEKKLIEKFIEKIKEESTYHKCIKMDVITQMMAVFNHDYEKKSYSKTIENPLETALQFYKEYNEDYYFMIQKGIRTGRIVINRDLQNSYTDTNSNKAYIKLAGNDGDIFILVHEFAHFIDRNSHPNIIPDEYNFLAEVFSFYLEKQLEMWLDSNQYGNLISTRRNNRMYFEAKMLRTIKYELFYEKKYQEKGKLEERDLSVEEVKAILEYDISNIVNYLLRYPLGNILSDYLINHHLADITNIWRICLDLNLYEVVEEIRPKQVKHII